MKPLLISQVTNTQLLSFAEHLPQSLVLVGPSGVGKETLLLHLAEMTIGEKWQPQLITIKVLADKKQISIDQVREIKKDLKLSTTRKRIVLIPEADKLTTEAQNSLLKLLEEPPAMTHFLLSTPKKSSLLDTILSRSVLWQFTKPTKLEISDFFVGIDENTLEKAMQVSDRRPGILVEILNDSKEHVLIASLETAKEILSASEFDRLCMLNTLTKEPEQLKSLLDALEIICRAALHNVANNKTNQKNVRAWQKRLKYIEEAISQIDMNIQPKLVISKLFLVL